MARLNNAFKNEAERLLENASVRDVSSSDPLIAAMCSLLIILLQQMQEKEENPSSSDLYAKPKKIIPGMIPYPS